MTKYKEFMRAKGIMLRCDFAALSCSDFEMTPYTDFYDVEFLGTGVLDNGVMAAACSNISGREYVVVDRYGDCSSFKHDKYMAYIEEARCPYEYIAYLQDTCYALPKVVHDPVFETMKRMYVDDVKVRTAFNHMRAGIMDDLVFCKWLAKRCQKILGAEIIVVERY